MNKNVILTGMMGVGKTTIGRNLANKLSFKFIDIDTKIERQEKNTINNIFKKSGEIYFRKIEAKITLLELKNNSSVISLGGGTFMNKTVRRVIKDKCISFWIDVNINKLISRLRNSNKRPLIQKKNLNETVNKIYLERKKFYNEADYRIKCSSLTKHEITEKICKIYENSRNKI